MTAFIMIRISIITFFISLFFFGQAQNLDQFYNSSFEPIELNQNSEQRFKELYTSYITKNEGKSEIDEKKFVYEYNYFLDRLNKSGKIFYGDEISQYLNDLKDFILEGNSHKTEIKVYLTDFPYVNAFTNDFGSIYINIASIAKLNSEEELLFLIAHEIGHVLKRHSHKSEIYSEKLKKERWTTGSENSAFSRHSFSKKQELESDAMAISLLSDKIDLKFGVDLLEGLESSANPVISGPVDFALLCGGDLKLQESFEKLWKVIEDSHVTSHIDPSNDDNSTHPTIELRVEKLNVLIERSVNQHGKYEPTGKFYTYKKLASKILLNTYIENSMYIAALDLVLKFRANDLDNEELIQKQISILTLLSQKMWESNDFNRIINQYGNACNDINHLKFRKIILSMTNEDLSIFAYRSIKKLSEKLPSQELNSSTLRSSYQLFFKNRPDLFVKNDSTNFCTYIAWDDSLNVVPRKTNLNVDEQTLLDSLITKGFIVANKSSSHLFLKSFIENNSISASESNHIFDYVAKEVSHEITNADFDFFQLPDVAVEENFRGVFLKSSKFNSKAKTVFFQSDNFYFKSYSKLYFQFEFEKSLKLDSKMTALTSSRSNYSIDYSNSSGKNVSVRDNNMHKLMGIWLTERSTHPIYSKVEDKLIPFLKSQNIQYVVYRICIINRNKGIGKKHYANYYEVYYDIDTGEIAYLAKIGSKQKVDDFGLENLIYLSGYNKDKAQ